MGVRHTSIRTVSHFTTGVGVADHVRYVREAKEKGLTSLAITDHRTVGGCIEFYNEGKKQGLPVALGVQVDIAGVSKPVTFLAKNQNGYKQLCLLTTLANVFDDGVRMSELATISDSEDLVCVTQTLEHRLELQSIFKNDLYFELSFYLDREKHNKDIYENVPKSQVVVSSDAYMPDMSDKIVQDILIDNAGYSKNKKTFDEVKYMMTLPQLLNQYLSNTCGIPQDYMVDVIKQTSDLVEECAKIELKFADQIVSFPHLLHPLNDDGCNKEQLLWKIIKKNNKIDFNNNGYMNRLNYEIQTIMFNSRVNLIDYFLVVEDLIRWSRANGILVGGGRGSSAGSLLNYCLDITRVDPMEYELPFERFISEGRIENGTLPDIDIDFSDPDLVYQYLREKYGEDRVMPVGTYQTLATRGALKDAFRTLYPDADFKKVNSITFLVDDDLKDMAENEAEFFNLQMEKNEPFRKAMEEYPKVVEVVGKLVGTNRQSGIHSCAKAITNDPISEFMPVRQYKGDDVLGYAAASCEQSGVIKYDLLGLKTLRIFKKTLQHIKNRYSDAKGGYLKCVDDIPLDNEQTFKSIMKGDTDGMFQFGSDIARSLVKQIPIKSIDDISLANSFIRPGPLANKQHLVFIEKINNPSTVQPPHPALREALKDSYGIMVYQENIMKCAEILGGYSPAETDEIRRAMGKKKLELLKQYKDGFLKNCYDKYPDTKKIQYTAEGKEETLAEHIWQLMITFSGYGFSKNHSIPYAIVGYQCQYLKVHYPLEWWAGAMSEANKDDLKRFYGVFKKQIVLPSINRSKDDYTIEYFDGSVQDENGYDVEGVLHMPFSVVKGLGEKAAEAIAEKAPYKDFEDFFTRVNKRAVNKGTGVKLIFAGVFDEFEKDKEKLLRQYFELRKDKNFPEEYTNMSNEYLEEKRVDCLPFLSVDYIMLHSPMLSKCVYASQLEDTPHDKRIWIAGKVSKVRKSKIKRGRQAGKTFATINIVNDDETYTVKAWSDQYELYKNKLIEKEILVVDGRVKKDYGDQTDITAIGIHTLEEVKEFGGLSI